MPNAWKHGRWMEARAGAGDRSSPHLRVREQPEGKGRGCNSKLARITPRPDGSGCTHANLATPLQPYT